MTPGPSQATARALALIGTPRAAGGLHTAYSAAREASVSLTTIYLWTGRLRRAKTEIANLEEKAQ